MPKAMTLAKMSCSVRYSRSGPLWAPTGRSRLPSRQYTSLAANRTASRTPSWATVRAHGVIDDSPCSDQPTPTGPLPPRLL